MNSETIIIYESIYNGNTEKMAKAMAHTLGCRYIKTKKALHIDLSHYKAIGFGSGIYFGSHHPSIFEVVNKLDRSRQDVFIFSSRGNPLLSKYHDPLKKILIEKEKNIRGEFSVRGYDGTGPWNIIGGGNKGKPNERDLKRAGKFLHNSMAQYCMPDFYKQLKTKFQVLDGVANTYKITANETSVVLKGDFVTINQSACVACGKCTRVCPMGIIQLIDHKAVPVTELNCTHCRLCVRNCVERAIHLHPTWRNSIQVAVRHKDRTSL